MPARKTCSTHLRPGVHEPTWTYAETNALHSACRSATDMCIYKYVQTLPNLSVAKGLIPPVQMNREFTYLGRRFSCASKPDSIKAAWERKLRALLNITSGLKIKAQTKMKFPPLYNHAQMLREIKPYDPPLTFIAQTLDALCVRHIRDWLEMPISACVSEVTSMTRKMEGLGIPTFKHLAQSVYNQTILASRKRKCGCERTLIELME